MTDTAAMPARHAVLQVAEFDAELVVYDPRAAKVHHLTDLTAIVFDACDGVTARAALVDEMVDALDVAPAEAAAAVDDALAALAAHGLLDGTEPSDEPPPCLGCGGEAHVAGGRRRWWGGRPRR